LATLSLSLFSKLIDSILADYPIFLLKVLFLLLILTEYFVESENEREEVKKADDEQNQIHNLRYVIARLLKRHESQK
jgi:uncharacterized membrane protein